MEGWQSIYSAVLVGTSGSEAAETVFLPLLFVFPTEISEIKTNLMLAQSTKRASGTDRPL